MKLFELCNLVYLDEREAMPQVTPLYSQSHNKQGGEGFIALKARTVVNPAGGTKNIKAGQRIYVTKPGTVFQGDQIGLPQGVYVMVGLNSSQPRSATGYMALSNIGNPQNTQSRVSKGAEAQQRFSERLYALLGGAVTMISSSAASSQAPDLVATYKRTRMQFEIKGSASHGNHITFFDKSIRRGGNDEMLNDIAAAFTAGKAKTFEKMIDLYRRSNQEVGFPGDEGTPNSGKLPPEFRVRDNPELLQRIRDHLVSHFQLNGDNYFAVSNHDTGTAEVFWTGNGANPMNAPEFPALAFAILDTYGGSYKGAMRVAMKVGLDPAAKGLEV